MSESSWRFALASVMGSSHRRGGTSCQDASACEIVERADASFVVASVSDGAGSARLSGIGSRLAVETVSAEARAVLEHEGGPETLERDFALRVLARLRARVQRLARRGVLRERDFACTLLAAIVGPDSAVFFQVGDGAIVTATPQGGRPFEWVFWPQRGEYANETWFATDPAAEQALLFERVEGPVHELALLSDGLQALVLDQRARAAHTAFFGPMFATVRRAPPGYSDELSGSLARYLSSPTVQRRTDDDTSLILVTRRASEPAPALPSAPAASAAPAPNDTLAHHEQEAG